MKKFWKIIFGLIAISLFVFDKEKDYETERLSDFDSPEEVENL